MIKQMRVVETDQQTASTPQLWAQTFAGSVAMTSARILQMKRAPEWSLICRHIPRGSTVLDAGCGFGEWVQVLESGGYKATGIDYSDTLIGRLRAAYPTGSWIHSDIRQMTVPSETFDAVVSWGVIEHDEKGPEAALREFNRVVRPGGIVIVSVPQDSPPQRRAERFLFPAVGKTAFFQYALTQDELNAAVTSVGFEVVSDGTIPGAAFAMMAPRACVWCRTQGRVGRLLEGVGSIVARSFRRYHLMIYTVARKPGGGSRQHA